MKKIKHLECGPRYYKAWKTRHFWSVANWRKLDIGGSSVYVLADRHGIIYVGSSNSTTPRFVEHLSRGPRNPKPGLTATRYFTLEYWASRSEARLREAVLIASLKPRFNKAGKDYEPDRAGWVIAGELRQLFSNFVRNGAITDAGAEASCWPYQPSDHFRHQLRVHR